MANVTEVGTYAFNGCHALESMGFSALETVGNLAFQGCDSLSTLYLGNVKTIGAQAFENCAALRIVYSNKRLETIGPRAFRNSGLVIAYMAKTVTSVGERAFEGCTNLEEIIIPDSLHSIPAQMCKGCTKLGTVHISSYVDDSIGSEAFANCTSLKTAYVTNQSVKFLGSSGKGPFSGCSDLDLYGYAPCTAKTYANGEPGVTFVDLSGADVEKVSVYFKASRWPDKEDATGSMPTTKTAKYGVFTLPSNEGFEWPGHIFAGWRVSHNGTESDYQPGHQIKNVRGDITCYALWREGSTVTLKRSASPSAETQTSTHALGSMYYVPICPFAVPTGQVFKYWIANDDGDGYLDEGKNANSEYEYAYNPGFQFQFDKASSISLELTACWTQTATVQLSANGGTFEDSTSLMSLQTNGEGKLDAFPEVSRDGFAFDYWQAYDNVSHTTMKVDFDTVLNNSRFKRQIDSSTWIVELTAIWKPNTARTIVLDPSGGTLNGSESPVMLTTNDKGQIADSTILGYIPVMPQYKFVKWNDPAGRIFAPGGQSTFVTDATLTALYRPIKVSKIDLNHTTLKLVKGVSRPLKATITPEDALNTEVTWSSSDPKVATVNEGGRVIAVGVGTAVITCASNDHGATATCTVTVETGLAPDGTAVGAGANKIAAQQYLTSYAKESDPKGSKYLPLQLMVSKVSKNSIKLTWKKAAGASYYHVYGAKCGTKKLVRVAMVPKSKSTYTWKKLSNKKLSKNTYYKAVVVAIAEHGKVISTSKMVHAATSGGKKGNCAKITTKAKDNKVTLKVGKTFKLGAKIVKPAGKKVAKHRKAKIVYVSSNKKIATVSSTGEIKAKKKGTCNIYAYAQNGKFVRIKVTVKKAVALTTAS